jgi:arginine exporter protein ArgO
MKIKWNSCSVFGLTMLITTVLYITGLFTVNVVSQHEPMIQNFIYAIGRVPILFVLLWVVLAQGTDDNED